MIFQTPITQVVLARGLRDLTPFDKNDSLLIESKVGLMSARPIFGSWLSIDVYASKGTLFLPHLEERVFVLERNGPLALVPKAVTTKLGIPRLAASLRQEAITSRTLDGDIETCGLKDELIIAGHSFWLDQHWCSSPMGVRGRDDRWSRFAPLGGPVAIALSVPVESKGGVRIDDFTTDLLEGNHIQDLTEACRLRMPRPFTEVLYCSCETIGEAIAMVVARKAWGTFPLEIKIPKKADPGWRRLIQHLGGLPTTAEQNSPECGTPVSRILDLLPPIDEALAARQINESTQVIPPNLIKRLTSQ